jgi:hypothetical protein
VHGGADTAALGAPAVVGLAAACRARGRRLARGPLQRPAPSR